MSRRRPLNRPRPARRGLSRPVPLALAVLVCLGAGLLAGILPGRHPALPTDTSDERVLAAAAATPPGDRVRSAVASVQDTGFHVGPELRGEIDAADVERIEQIIADAPVPVFAIWWEETWEAGYFPPESALDQVRAAVGEEGLYVIVSPARRPLVGALGYRRPVLEADGRGRPVEALTRVVTEVAEADAVRPGQPIPSRDYWGGPGGGFAAGLLLAGLAYLALLLLVAVLGGLFSLLPASPRQVARR